MFCTVDVARQRVLQTAERRSCTQQLLTGRLSLICRLCRKQDVWYSSRPRRQVPVWPQRYGKFPSILSLNRGVLKCENQYCFLSQPPPSNPSRRNNGCQSLFCRRSKHQKTWPISTNCFQPTKIARGRSLSQRWKVGTLARAFAHAWPVYLLGYFFFIRFCVPMLMLWLLRYKQALSKLSGKAVKLPWFRV